MNVNNPRSPNVSAYCLYLDYHCWLYNLHQQEQTCLTGQLMDPSQNSSSEDERS